MDLLRPELLLLALPAGLAWWRLRGAGRATAALRLLALAVLVVALAGPRLRTAAAGRDLVVVVDRSLSVPAEAADGALETIALAEKARRSGDRVGVVSFGREAAVERPLSEGGRLSALSADVDPNASDLAGALDLALELLPEGRHGSVLVVSDGEATGRDPLDAARLAYARGVRVDVKPFARAGLSDVAVERIELPPETGVGEPFQFAVWVRSDRRVESEFELSRGGRVLSSGRRVLEEGRNRIVFRDVLEEPGVASYSVRLGAPEDRVPENDRGLGAVLARGPRSVLLLNADGAESALSAALRAAGLEVAVAAPEEVALDALPRSPHRALVLENVPASRVGATEGVRQLVLDLGGGLLVTGGKASFGIGGWHRTPVDEVLPVSLETRREHRKQGVALAIVLDRSGSMAMPAGGGATKMDLANAGAAAAIELLSPMDSVAVIAVDSSPHVVQPLAAVEDPGELSARVRRIESMGGGIFVRTGLLAAGRELEDAPQSNRHVILFADAADAEEPEGVVPLVTRYRERMGTTVSVVGLGTPRDADAAFLRAIAKAGGGEVYFTAEARELPKLFARDVLTFARSQFVEEPTSVRLLPDVFGLGDLIGRELPDVEGYNLTYLHEDSLAAAMTEDEMRAPLLAFRYAGLGRTAAYTGQVGGTFGAAIAEWPGASDLFGTVARWCLGQEEPEEVFVSTRREGSEAVVALEIDPEAARPPSLSQLAGRMRLPGGGSADLSFERIGPARLEARVELGGEGIALGAVSLGEGRTIALPPVALPYSPEFEPSPDPRRGERLLRRIAVESGGRVHPAADELLRGPREARATRLVSRELALLALLLLLAEIAGRRLHLWSTLRPPRALAGALARVRARLPRRRPPARHDAEPQPPAEAAPPDEPPPREERPGVASALEAARRRSRRRLGR